MSTGKSNGTKSSRRGEALTKEELDAYIEAYARKESLVEIGMRYRRSSEYVRRHLIAAGVTMRSSSEPQLSDEDLFVFADMYQRGMNFAEIIRQRHTSYSTVRMALERFDVPMRPVNRVTEDEAALFEELYVNEKKSLDEIRAVVNRPVSTISLYLRKRGVTLRPVGGTKGMPRKKQSTT